MVRLTTVLLTSALFAVVGCGDDKKSQVATKLEQSLPPPPSAGGAGGGKGKAPASVDKGADSRSPVKTVD